MLKSREAAKILENIVGPDNFSEDPAIISSYVFQFAAPALGVEPNEDTKDLFDIAKMGAVIMPGSTEEVQAIVKVCNRYKINFKAFSTGLGAYGMPLKEGSLQVDMKRMNRIIKLDDKNMYAVVEPYVSGRQVQVAVAKKGLTCHVISSQTSILASVTSMGGAGHSAHTTSHSARNCLGAEWVLPTGEVVSWGLVDEGKAGHPGPGLMGICRGGSGTMGSLGIFTKAAVKLYPWPGPAQMEITGRNPNAGFRIPDNFKVYHLRFAGPEKIGDAIYKLADAEIAYHIWHFPLFFHPQRWMAESNDEHYEIWKKFEAAGIINKNLDALTVVIAAYSEKELNYKETVMKDIMSETGAAQLQLPGSLATEEHDMERFFCAQIAAHKVCTELRVGGGDMGTSWIQIQCTDGSMKAKKPVREIQRKYVAQGMLTDVAGESGWGGPMERKALGHIEFMHFTDPTRAELLKAREAFMRETTEFAIKEKLLGDGSGAGISRADRIVSKYLGDYFDYRRKIKEALDPNGVGDRTVYLDAPDE